MPQVSIIVPVYQTKKYLDRCVKSIISQQYSDFELILVDDGSTDGSGEICDCWAKEDVRIKVIHKKNEGVSVARNVGIQHANGTYVQFVDSDDWVEDNYTGRLVQIAEENNCDLVLAGYSMHSYSSVKPFSASNCISTGGSNESSTQIALSFLDLYRGHLLNPPFNKLYKKSCIKELFPAGITLGEDFIFNMRYLLHVKSFSVSLSTAYCYECTNQNSATKTFGYYSVEDLLAYCQSAEKFLLQHMSSAQAKRALDWVVFDQFCGYLTRLVLNKKYSEAQKEVKSIVKKQPIHAAVFDRKLIGITQDKNFIRILLRQGHIGCAIFITKLKNRYRRIYGKSGNLESRM